MDASQIIRDAVDQVAGLRAQAARDRSLAVRVSAVKRFQSQRFAGSYHDLLQGGPYQAAANFFLGELYGDADYADRDAQFARIAGAIQRLLPAPAVATAVALARLHALTEQLDHHMATAWPQRPAADPCDERRAYVQAWRGSGRRSDRERQLQLVLEIGQDLDRLTRTPGLRLLLKMMRGPAQAAGLHALQHFLEAGFDTFAAMGRRPGASQGFLRLIESRESALLATLFDADLDSCLAALRGPAAPAGAPG